MELYLSSAIISLKIMLEYFSKVSKISTRDCLKRKSFRKINQYFELYVNKE